MRWKYEEFTRTCGQCVSILDCTACLTKSSDFILNSVDEVKRLFISIDQAVFDFVTKFEISALTPIELEIKGRKRPFSPFELFTHLITHEFHHKGQVLSLSRHWGYLPVDTDIIG